MTLINLTANKTNIFKNEMVNFTTSGTSGYMLIINSELTNISVPENQTSFSHTFSTLGPFTIQLVNEATEESSNIVTINVLEYKVLNLSDYYVKKSDLVRKPITLEHTDGTTEEINILTL